MFRRFAEFVLLLKWPILMCLLLITAILGGAMSKLHIDPSMESLFIKGSEEYLYYKEYREKYGSDQIIAVAVETTGLFTNDNLRKLERVTKQIETFENVDRVLSLTNVMDIRHKFMGIKIVPALEDVFSGEESLEDARDSVTTNELYVGNLVSENGKVANVLVFMKPPQKKNPSGGKLIESLRTYLVEEQTEDFKFYIAGSPVEQYDFIRLIRDDQFTFVPLIAGLLIFTTLIIYRSFACMVLSMSIVFMTIVWLIGTMVLLGYEMNLMTSLLAPVIMIIAVVNSIHLMNLFFELRAQHPSLRMSVILTIEQLGAPCFLTHFTTVLGFASLAISPIPAISTFGLFAALGTAYSYIVEMVLTPILLPILPYRRISKAFDQHSFLNKVIVTFLEKLDFNWKWLIMLLSVAVITAAGYGVRFIQVDTNIVKQMKPDLPLAIATRFIDDHLTGVYTLGYVLEKKGEGDLSNYDSLMKIDQFKDFLESKPEITKVNSITTLIKKIHSARKDEDSAYLIPEKQKTLDRYFEGFRESDDPEIWKLISKDFREVRLEGRMKAVGTSEGALVEDAVRRYVRKHLADDFELNQTGNVVLLGRMAKDLVHQQMKSFGIAFASILVLIIIIFRSLRMGLLAAIPSLFPIVSVYGLMGYLGIELSSTTAMISSIVLGMVVDASIHFLHRFKYEFSKRHHYVQSLHYTFLHVGQALTVSTLILVTGFGSSIFASFKPTVHFGVLTSLTVLFALVCTLVILPVCLVALKPFGKERLFSSPQVIRRKHWNPFKIK